MPINSFENYPMSWKPDRALLRQPYYLSLAAALENDIARGLLPPGTRLPPQRELADYLDLNFTTVTRAYKLCSGKGLVYGVVGRGTFVAPNALRSVTITADCPTGNFIELGFGASFESCNVMLEGCIARVAARHTAPLLDYSHPSGMPHQKLAGLRWMSAFGISADPAHTAIVSGAMNALALTLLALFPPGSSIAVDTYTFANFIELSKICHVHLVPVVGDLQGMLPEALDTACRKSKIQGIFLIPSCCNPTATVVPDARRLALARVIKTHGLTVIEDDVHAFLAAGALPGCGTSFYSLLPGQTVYICSTSNSICSGLRVAYMVFGEKFRERLLTAIYNVNVKTSALDAEIVTEAILSGTAEKIIGEKRRLAREANALFARYFPKIPLTGHPLSYYRWLPIADAENGGAVEAALLEKGIRVYHSDRFLCGEEIPGKYLRVFLASAGDMARLEAGLDILSRNVRLP